MEVQIGQDLIQILDNEFDEKALGKMNEDFLMSQHWGCHNRAMDYNSARFFAINFNSNSQSGRKGRLDANDYDNKREEWLPYTPQIVKDIHNSIKEKFLTNEYVLEDSHANCQTIMQDGPRHVDVNSKASAIIMTNPLWHEGYGGETEFLDTDGNIHLVDFVPGRIIMFNGQIPHRALAPRVAGIFRITLNFQFGVKNAQN